jgi:tRNA(fMet)-specific endonuclease VapC
MSNHPLPVAKLNAIGPTDEVGIAATVRGEVLYGISRLPRGARRQLLMSRAQRLFDLLPCEAVSAPMADQYAIIKAKMESKGTSVAEGDLWIAAAAIHLGAVLVTRDRVFQRITDLIVEDWTV